MLHQRTLMLRVHFWGEDCATYLGEEDNSREGGEAELLIRELTINVLQRGIEKNV